MNHEPNRFKKYKYPMIFGALVALVLLVTSFIPSPSIERHSMELNRLPDEVWTIINDIEGYSRWWPAAPRIVTAPKRSPDGSEPETWKVVLPDKKTQDLIVITTYERPSRLVRTVEGSFGSKRWTFELVASGDHTLLNVSENGNLAEYLVHSVTASVGIDSRLTDFVKHLDQLLSN